MNGKAYVCLVTAVLATSVATWATEHSSTATPAALAQLPLSIEENHGQASKDSLFVARTVKGITARFERAGVRLDSPAGISLRLEPVGGAMTRPVAESRLPGKVNYLIGNDRKRWVTEVPTHRRVRYAQVYRGVDLVFYGDQQRLEYDLELAPGMDAHQVALRVKGADAIRVRDDGSLLLTTGHGDVAWERPRAYQLRNGVRQPIEARYALLDGDSFGFVLGPHDAKLPTVIDPVLEWSTLVGGTGSPDAVNAIAADRFGNVYIAGTTNIGYPVTPGAYDQGAGTDAGTSEGFVTKIKSDGSALIWATYIGGSSHELVRGIAVNSYGNVYLTGETWGNFPLSSNALQKTHGTACSSDAFIAKLNNTGSHLLYGSYYGGSGCESGYGITVDSNLNTYVGGSTDSPDLKTSTGAYQRTYRSRGDGFALKLNSSFGLVYATYFGGSASDSVLGIAVNKNDGSLYLTGACGGGTFPMSATAFDKYCTAYDAYVARLSSNGGSLMFSASLGHRGGYDIGQAVAVDGSGNAYVTGYTQAPQGGTDDFPITANAYQKTVDSTCQHAFVSKVNPTGTTLLYSTYLGGTVCDQGRGITVDSSGRAYVTGWTHSADFPVTADAFQPVYHGDANFPYEAFFTRFNSTGSALTYSTFLGGAKNDQGNAIALGVGPSAYVGGQACSDDFPTTAGAYQRTQRGGCDGFVSKFNLSQ
jgi:hypothetical protein